MSQLTDLTWCYTKQANTKDRSFPLLFPSLLLRPPQRKAKPSSFMGKKCQHRGRVPNPRKHAAEEAAQACAEESQACSGAAEADAAESAQTRAAAELCSCPTCRSRGGGPCRRRDTTPDQLSAPCRGSAVATQLSASSRGGAAPNPYARYLSVHAYIL
jgi:hypothetical protein